MVALSAMEVASLFVVVVVVAAASACCRETLLGMLKFGRQHMMVWPAVWHV